MHEKSKRHKWSMVAWISAKSKSPASRGLSDLQDKHKREIDQNRLYLRTIIESLIFIARQNIGCRGHTESQSNIAG